MAMNPMQKKARTSFLLGMLLTLVIAALIIGFLIWQIAQMKEEEESIVYTSVYVMTTEVKSGDYVAGGYTLQTVDSSYVPSNAITASNMATYLTENTTAKIELGVGTILTTEMLNVDGTETTSDVRLQEYNMILLPTYLSAGDYIDIRLRLPSGEDYIVISKKYVEDTDDEEVWIEVSEDEILSMSNAIVEAYIMEGSLLYATTYSDAGMQEAASPTYIPSSSVISLMQSDPNITVTAWNALAERINTYGSQRDTINSAVSSYNEEAIDNVENGVEEEIEKQQAARQEYIDSLSAAATTTTTTN